MLANIKLLKALSAVATVVLAATNVYWVFDTMRQRKEDAQKLKAAQQSFAGRAKKAA